MSAKHISVAEAASRLGVNQARVRAMIAAGLLDAVKMSGRWLIAPESIDRLKDNARPVGRPFSLTKAWGLLMVAAGERPDWLSPWDLSRIRRRLREQGLLALVPRLRGRAVLHRLRTHPSDTKRITTGKNVVRTGISAAESRPPGMAKSSRRRCGQRKHRIQDHGGVVEPVFRVRVALHCGEAKN
jgi:excisionase family DNA binding protein